MHVEEFVRQLGSEYFVGVPDSQLRALCDYLMLTYGIDGRHHMIAANEGCCTGMAAGYYLATGKTPVVYMQNSGEGNAINPIASLLNEAVYGIPCIFVIGWRGEPGVHDEPQHIYQGKVTLQLLDTMDISCFVVDSSTTVQDVHEQMEKWRETLAAGRQVAFVIRKGALEYEQKAKYQNEYPMRREDIVEKIADAVGEDMIVSTTGKASRELFEIRERNAEDHSRDFLTVGSMGHSASIALGIALQKSDKRIWCIDGDGAVLMHMGAMAVIGSSHPKNLIHVVVNNGAHETVGGMPTVALQVNLPQIAEACGYKRVWSVDTMEALGLVLEEAKAAGELCFIEVRSAIGGRKDLGRPTLTPREIRDLFMRRCAR